MSKTDFNVTMKSNEDDLLAKIAQEFGLSESDVNIFDTSMKEKYEQYMKLLEEDKDNNAALTTSEDELALATIAAIIAVIGAACGAIAGAYQIGRYAARQCEVRLGLTKAMFKANKAQVRIAVLAATLPGGVLGAAVFVGFDDYYSGV